MIIASAVRDTLEQNGTTEALGKAITAIARSLIIKARLPRDLWPKTIKVVVYILNRVLTRIRKEDDLK